MRRSVCAMQCAVTGLFGSFWPKKSRNDDTSAARCPPVYVQYNPNHVQHKRVGDCVIRALSKALEQTWEATYTGVALQGFAMGDMPSANAVWGSYLRRKGFSRYVVPHEYGDVYTVSDFARDHPQGTYILAIDGHVVCVKDGDIYDSWDSSNEIPVYYWART